MAPSLSERRSSLAALAVVGLLVLWAYWPALAAMAEKWSSDPQYSHGFLVPAFAAFLLWRRRKELAEAGTHPSAWGFVLIALGVGLHLAGGYLYFDWLDMLALLPLLAGVCVCYGGRRALRWSWPAIAFLVFMLPLPYRMEVALSHPLQRLATFGSTYTLQTLGFAAVSEGNVIILDDARIGVVTACNGLGMLVTFFAMATAVAILVRRPPLDKVVIVLSAVPIALVANVLRITVTGIVHAKIGGAVADIVFHDLAGWLMMPIALGLLWVELGILSRLLLEPEPEAPPTLAFATPVRAAEPAKPAKPAKPATIPGARPAEKKAVPLWGAGRAGRP